jgi:DNA repair protein RAD5
MWSHDLASRIFAEWFSGASPPIRFISVPQRIGKWPNTGCSSNLFQAMDPDELSGPPAKKRRFFASSHDNNTLSNSSATDVSQTPKRFFQDHVEGSANTKVEYTRQISTSLPGKLGQYDNITNGSSIPISPTTYESENARNTPPIQGFDQETLESFIGTKVDQDVIQILRTRCEDSLERAVNMYFDGTWKKYLRSPSLATSSCQSVSATRAASSTQLPATETELNRVSIRCMPNSRYIGAFGVEGWATRSGKNLVSHGDAIKIERQKIQPPPPPKTKSKFGTATNTPRISPMVSKRVDVVVRFTNATGTELGRLSKDTANWVSTLLDQGICKFEGTCVYAPESVRSNDTIFLQLKCSLLMSAFDSPASQLTENRSTGLFEEKETEEEKSLRLRRVALVRLFQEINLMPTRVKAAAAQDQRQGLLQVAEMDERKDGPKQHQKYFTHCPVAGFELS